MGLSRFAPAHGCPTSYSAELQWAGRMVREHDPTCWEFLRGLCHMVGHGQIVAFLCGTQWHRRAPLPSAAPQPSAIGDQGRATRVSVVKMEKKGPKDPELEKKKVIVVLEKAALETVKTKKGFELVCADTHSSILKKLKKEASEYRPDILHQCLLTLLDSPLNKAGHLKVYIHTTSNVLIEVSPHIRIPRTFKRFSGLMVQLLHKLKIRSSDGPDVLLRIVKNPITAHLPAGAVKLGTSVQGKLIDLKEFVPTLPEKPIVFVVGSHAHGPADVDWTEQSIAVSQYPLSASVALGRICNAFENHWGIL